MKKAKRYDRLHEIILDDKKDEFVSFLEKSVVVKSGDHVKLKYGESESCPYEILQSIIIARAIGCGTAFLKAAKGGLIVDLNVPLRQGYCQGNYPLHVAAGCILSAGVIELLLRHGAQIDVRSNSVHEYFYGLLPLQVALKSLSSDYALIEWTPKFTIFELIILLCLPKMKNALEAIRVLARHTKNIKEVIRKYAKDGRLIELAILLMVAREKVLGPITIQSKDYSTLKGFTTLRECVNSELAAVIDQEYSLIGLKEFEKSLQMCKKRKAAMISTLFLLEIFERAGVAIGAYVQLKQADVSCNLLISEVPSEVAKLLAEAGFVVTNSELCITLLARYRLFDLGFLIKEEEEPAWISTAGYPHAIFLSTMQFF